MAIYKGDTALKAYKGDMQPVNIYKGNTKVAGWHAQDVTSDGIALKNLIANGDFSNGTTMWTLVNGTATAANNELAFTVLSADVPPFTTRIFQTIGTIAGHKYYTRGNVRRSNADVIYQSVGAASVSFSCIPDSYISYSTIVTAINTTSNSLYFSSQQTGEIIYVKNLLTIDLTAHYGAGNEPSAAYMDTYLALRYVNSWFNGSSTAISLDGAYNVPPDALVFDGKCVQTGTPSPSTPAPITNVGNLAITATGGGLTDTASAATVELLSLPDGTVDTYDAVTGVLTHRCAKVVFDGTNADFLASSVIASQVGVYRRGYFNAPIAAAIVVSQSCYVDKFSYGVSTFNNNAECWGIDGVYFRLKILVSRLTADTHAALQAWLAANPVTVVYKLATPTTTQLTPDLPVIRTGIKQLSVAGDVAPVIHATVKAMD
jgi:hypothetical protein